MNIETVIYLANVTPNISNFLFFCSVASAITLSVISVILKIEAFGEKENEQAHNFIKKYLVSNIKWIFLCIVLSSLIPSERTIYLMLGANYLKTSTLPSKVEMAIEKKIDSYLVETDKDKK